MRWTIKPKPSEDKIKHLAQALHGRFCGYLLVAWDWNFWETKNFFRPSLDHHDPYLMKDMDKSGTNEAAIETRKTLWFWWLRCRWNNRSITGIFLLKIVLSNVATYIPDRYDEGYGISFKGIDFADDNGISLIIALDCGIKSLDHVAYARNEISILSSVITTDLDLPEAIAV
jgi:single-stranded-DNA-specific exonuclease